jgi:hypothetical protein
MENTKWLFPPLSDGLTQNASRLAERVNKVCEGFENIGFTELCEPDNFRSFVDDPDKTLNQAIILRARREGLKIGSQIPSDSGILAMIEKPDMSFFDKNHPGESNFDRFFFYLRFDDKKRRYDVNDKMIRIETEHTAIPADEFSIRILEDLTKWVELSQKYAMDRDILRKIGDTFIASQTYLPEISRDFFTFIYSREKNRDKNRRK